MDVGDQPKRVEIDGVTYELRRWDSADGLKWYFRMLALAGASLLSGIPLGAILASFNALELAQLWDTCRKYSFRVTPGDRGEDVARLLELEDQKPSVRTPYIAITGLLREHVNIEYADFFSKLPAPTTAGKTDGALTRSPPV